MGEQMALIPIPTDNERILLARLGEARREAAIARTLLAASFEREKDQDITIRELRRELLHANDVAGRAEGAEPKFVASEFSYKWMAVTKDGRFIGG